MVEKLLCRELQGPVEGENEGATSSSETWVRERNTQEDGGIKTGLGSS